MTKSSDYHTNTQCVLDKTDYTLPHTYILWWKICLWSFWLGDLWKMPSSCRSPQISHDTCRSVKCIVYEMKPSQWLCSKVLEWVLSAMVVGLITCLSQLSLCCPMVKEHTIISLPNGTYRVIQGVLGHKQEEHPQNKTISRMHFSPRSIHQPY